jgi:peptidoglycan-associated lipoprotein
MKITVLLLSLFLLSGCENLIKPTYHNTDLSGGGFNLSSGELYGRSGRQLRRVFYFELDSFRLSAEDQQELLDHARFLKAVNKAHVKVEGHGDERGSREYNLALGANRAKAVAKILAEAGVPDSQVTSYGEERPVDYNHNESAWRKNRRVELIY